MSSQSDGGPGSPQGGRLRSASSAVGCRTPRSTPAHRRADCRCPESVSGSAYVHDSLWRLVLICSGFGAPEVGSVGSEHPYARIQNDPGRTGIAELSGPQTLVHRTSQPYYGEHPVIERHYVSARSRRQPSILVFLAQDAAGRAFCYSNADLRKGDEADEIFNFISFWKRTHGQQPRHLVFDSRLTTYANLARLDKMGISFITLRRRSPALLKEITLLPRSAWRTVELDVPTRKFRFPRVYEQKVSLAGCSFRQLFIQDLGHDEPTILLTNQYPLSHKKLITRYAQRMLIENALSDAVRFFHIDALSSTVGLKIDFDMVLLVVASGLYRILAKRMRGYSDAQARQIFRDLVDMPADVTLTEREVEVSFHCRAHLPIILASGLIEQPISVPSWNGLKLRLTTYNGPNRP